MANVDRPQGFRPYGAPLRVQDYEAGGTINAGDAVKLKNDGTVEVAAATNALIGVAVHGASDGERVAVYDDPNQLFVVQASASDVDAQTDIGLNYDLLAGSANSYGISGHELDSTSGATTATLPLRLVRIEPRTDNALGAQVDCVVRLNNHQMAGGTGTAGV